MASLLILASSIQRTAAFSQAWFSSGLRARAHPACGVVGAPGCRVRLSTCGAAMSADHGGKERELLFIYGSLMSSKVLEALIHRTPQIQPAVLRGFHRFRIRERPYPAIAPVPPDFSPGEASSAGGLVNGLLLCGLSVEEHALLDYFEDNEYVKQTVEVTVCRQPHAVAAPGYLPQDTCAFECNTAQASAYVYARMTDDLYGEWSIDKFLRSDVLPGYIGMSAECRDDYYLSLNPPDEKQ